MTITINLPIFPLRREIAALKQRLGRSPSRAPAAGSSAPGRREARYSLDGFEFDVAALAQLPRGSRSVR